MTEASHIAATGAAAHAAQDRFAGIRIGVSKEEFLRLLDLIDEPLVAVQKIGFGIRLLRLHRYATHYRGFAVFANSRDELVLPEHVEVIEANTVR